MTLIRIESQRLIIRSPVIEDAPTINAAVHASAGPLRAWMPWANPLPTVEQTTAFLRGALDKMANHQEYHFLVSTRDGALVGVSGMHNVDWRIPSAEIGYWADERQSKRGYTTESTSAITEFARNVMGMRRIQIVVSDRNEPSWRIPERLGYTLEGTLRNHRVNPDGRTDHSRFYAITNDAPQPVEPWAQLHRHALAGGDKAQA